MNDEAMALTALIEGIGAVVETPVTIVESKTLRYPTATTTREGTCIDDVAVDLAALIIDQGWAIALNEPIDVSQSPASHGHRIGATRNGLVVDISIFDQLGVNSAPQGSFWVQLRLSHPNPALAWTQLNSAR